MPQLITALVILSTLAGACGFLVGLCLGFTKDEFADARAHPLIAMLAGSSNKRGNTLINILLALVLWVIFLYGVPKVVFLLLGIDDIAAYGMSFFTQMLFAYIGLEIGERKWKHIA